MKTETSNQQMKDKVCLVTGGTSGVGKAIAAGLAKLGGQVIITCRDRAKGNAVVAELKETSSNPSVECRYVDLSLGSSIRDFAEAFRRDYQVLHVLANNAATFPMKRKETDEGIEMIWATNYLGHFLLTHLLMDLLKAGTPSRVITVSGNPGPLRRGRINFDDPQFTSGFNPFRATLHAAYAKVLFSLELSRRLAGTGVSSNTFHPGLVKSSLARQFPAVLRPGVFIFETFLREECPPGVFAASDPGIEGISGKFIKGSKALDFNSPGYTDETGKRLWEISCRSTGIKQWM